MHPAACTLHPAAAVDKKLYLLNWRVHIYFDGIFIKSMKCVFHGTRTMSHAFKNSIHVGCLEDDYIIQTLVFTDFASKSIV